MLNCRLLCLMVFALPAMAGAAGNSPVVAIADDYLARLRAARLGTDSPESERVLHGVLQDELERSIGVRVCLRRRRA